MIAKLTRMCGGTNLHTGTDAGKMDRNVCGDRRVPGTRWRGRPWHNFKRVWPVASGGLYPQKVRANLDCYGMDVILQAGGGIHGHPDGDNCRREGDVPGGRSVEGYTRRSKSTRRPTKSWPAP